MQDTLHTLHTTHTHYAMQDTLHTLHTTHTHTHTTPCHPQLTHYTHRTHPHYAMQDTLHTLHTTHTHTLNIPPHHLPLFLSHGCLNSLIVHPYCSFVCFSHSTHCSHSNSRSE